MFSGFHFFKLVLVLIFNRKYVLWLSCIRTINKVHRVAGLCLANNPVPTSTQLHLLTKEEQFIYKSGKWLTHSLEQIKKILYHFILFSVFT